MAGSGFATPTIVESMMITTGTPSPSPTWHTPNLRSTDSIWPAALLTTPIGTPASWSDRSGDHRRDDRPSPQMRGAGRAQDRRRLVAFVLGDTACGDVGVVVHVPVVVDLALEVLGAHRGVVGTHQ